MTARWLAVAHELPERTRLRTPILRKDIAACERVADALSSVGGVREVRVKPYTGSVLVLHADDVTSQTLVGVVARALDNPRILAPGERPPVDGEVPALTSLARTLVHAIREIDDDVKRATDGTVDLGTLTTLGFVGAGALEIASTGQLPLPPWFNLAWWGFRTFVTTEQEEIRAECDGAPCAPDPAAGA